MTASSLISSISASSLALSLPIPTLLRVLDRASCLKWLVCLVFLLNFKSWPLFWHFRIFRPVIRVWLRDVLHSLRLRLQPSKARREQMEEEWIDTAPLVGVSPFEWRNVYRTRATIDECDFNIHLSNSSYAKILDASRLECVVTLFPVFFRSGGAMALGATHFHFMREIPPFQDFEIRSYIGSWDRKWLYLVSKYVTKPKEGTPPSPPPFLPQQQSHLPSPASSGTSTPTTPIPYQSLLVEKDGWVVHTVAVAQLCFKAGRITVPPSIVLASNGFCVFPYTSPIPYSTISTDPSRKPNPPPHWAEVKKLVSPKHGGSLRKYFEFLRSGWKEVGYEDGERWWETALGGEVEAQRERALAELELLKKGLEGARSL